MNKYIYNISIDCPNCAKKVERELQKDSRIESAQLDFNNKKLHVTTSLSRDEIIKMSQNISDEIFFENTYIYKAKIDCAECAKKVERALNENKSVSFASFDFPKEKLTVKTTLSKSEIEKICKDVEDEIVLLEEDIDTDDSQRNDLIKITLAVVIFIIAFISKIPYLYLISYAIAGYEVLLKAIKNIFKGKIFDENFLMSIATVGAVVLSSFSEAAAVMIFYQIGEYFQQKAVRKSRKSIKALLDISAKEALLEDGSIVSVEKIEVGSIIVVRPGEKVALDGTVIEGVSSLDEKALTGESIPVDVEVGSNVLSGSINLSSPIKIKVTKRYDESTATKIVQLIETNNDKKSSSEQFITKFSRYYTPLVCLLALIVALVVPLIIGEPFSPWIYRAMELLVVSCPCALVLSIPLSYFASIGAFARHGVLVKGSDVVEKLSKVNKVAFDKTGTLTKGELCVSSVVNLTELDILPYIASLESSSTHPIAKAIVSYYNKSLFQVSKLVEIPGKGVMGTINGQIYYAGNSKLFKSVPKVNETVVYFGKDETVLGFVTLSDQIKEDALLAVKDLKNLGVQEVTMISGDKAETCKEVANKLDLDSYHAELLPDQKLSTLKSMMGANNTVLYCGDGINDAPSLAQADIGVSMGTAGSDAAIEQSDMVIVSDNPSKISKAIKISRKTEVIVKENIIFSLLIKLIVIVLSIIGLSSMWLAIFSDVGVALIAVINAMRSGKSK
ncbi:heavy metal translocating P-type ATPase [Bullifex sp.]|uniref:heavy metal translocating P-type ATPase n=1 Tax=Bullifex sp. TaxID=2815808 RepID=UPI002A81AD30|nr:heavy metal translocating P-type ATPase [Bullifex sp.]MDY4066248.1 heavy metal translocating P-type ATPase [Bullifex sp.]